MAGGVSRNKGYDCPDRKMPSMQQIDAGCQVKANGEIKEKWVSEVVEGQIQLMVKDTNNGEETKNTLQK